MRKPFCSRAGLFTVKQMASADENQAVQRRDTNEFLRRDVLVVIQIVHLGES